MKIQTLCWNQNHYVKIMVIGQTPSLEDVVEDVALKEDVDSRLWQFFAFCSITETKFFSQHTTKKKKLQKKLKTSMIVVEVS